MHAKMLPILSMGDGSLIQCVPTMNSSFKQVSYLCAILLGEIVSPIGLPWIISPESL